MYNISRMNKLSIDRRVKIIKALVEGNSIRATCRMTDTAKGTVIRLLADVGKACADYQDKHLRDLLDMDRNRKDIDLLFSTHEETHVLKDTILQVAHIAEEFYRKLDGEMRKPIHEDASIKDKAAQHYRSVEAKFFLDGLTKLR